jgi:hypothetical protein
MPSPSTCSQNSTISCRPVLSNTSYKNRTLKKLYTFKKRIPCCKLQVPRIDTTSNFEVQVVNMLYTLPVENVKLLIFSWWQFHSTHWNIWKNGVLSPSHNFLFLSYFRRKFDTSFPFTCPHNCFSMLAVSVSEHLSVRLMSCKVCGEPQDQLKIILNDDGNNLN